jgi:predicted transcriptional regulator
MRRYYDENEVRESFNESLKMRQEYGLKTSDINIRPIEDENGIKFWIIGTSIQGLNELNLVRQETKKLKEEQKLKDIEEKKLKNNEKKIREKLEQMKTSSLRKILLKLKIITDEKVERLEKLLKDENFIQEITNAKRNLIRYETPEHDKLSFEEDYQLTLEI